jgi:PAS domain S-box-containing protein
MKEKNPVKILMVDDLPENLFALEIILSKQNYTFVKANSGNEALKILLYEQDFAIILIDVQMPEMDGFETVELIRQIDNLQHVPIIFLTASMDNTSHIFKGYQAGAVDYMIKPLSPEILKAKVSVFVDLYKKNQELLAQKEELKILYRDVKAQKLLSDYSLSLIEASHDPLFAINTQGKITDRNDASARVTGISREKLIGTNFFDYFTEPQKARKLYLDVFENGFVTDSPLRFRHKKGKLTDVLFNGSVYKDEKGNVVGVVIVARDVTALKKNENKLIEAKIKAEEAVKSKQQFLSNMSHEIRTPMNAIIGFTKVLLKTDLNRKQQEYLSAIEISGDTLIVLINDILDLAKVDAGKMIFEKSAFKVTSSISAMLHLLEPKIIEKNLTLVKEYDPKIPEMVLGDSIRLNQIILNLVSNSVKFTPKGKIKVSVKLIEEEADDVIIEFSVMDTGIGIAQDKMETIFDNFQQATSDTTRLYGGTGLGLAIVKQLVESQGGRIQVESKMNEGSTFSFKLSFEKTKKETHTKNYNEEDDKNKFFDSKNKNIKVLVVEDNSLNQLLMRTLMDDFGFAYEIAENGKIAIDKLQKDSYNIILMDLQMPEMNGFEAADYIRNTLNSEIPIIALTADVTTVDRGKCKALGMNDYLSKPIEEELLYNTIIDLVKKPFTLIDENGNNEDKKRIQKEKIKCTDLEYLSHRTKSNPKLMMEIISIYLEQTPPLVTEIKQSLRNKDWPQLNAAIHKIIPSFSIMGISPDFENMAKTIQDFSSTQQLHSEIDEMVLQLEEICDQACEELELEYNIIKNTKL